jgi:ribosomal protein L24
MQKLRKDRRTVIVISGKDKGKTGQDHPRGPRAAAGLRRGHQHGQAPPAPEPRAAQRPGGVIEKEGPVHVSNVALRDPKDRKPTRGRRRARPRTAAHARHQALGHRDRLIPWHASKDHYNERSAPPDREVRLRQRDAGAQADQDHAQHGRGEAKQDAKMLEAAQGQLAAIAGQQPNVRRARKSVAAFKLREGMPVGLTVTLRDERAYEFLDRLTAIAIPRIRDFRG